MRLLSRLIFLFIFSTIYSQTNFNFVLSNSIPDYKVSKDSIQYEKKKFFPFSSVGSKINSAFIQNRSYGGIGQANTISIDGGLSSHTRVGWNNLNIEIGQMSSFDVSLLPLEFVEQIEIYRDNLSSYGVFGQGGFVNFLSTSMTKNAVIDFSLESYDTYQGKLILNSIQNGFKGKAGFSFISSSNSYPYIDKYGFSNNTQNLDFKRMSFFSDIILPYANFSITHTYKNGGTGLSYNTSPRQEDIFDTFSISTKIFETTLNSGFINWENNYNLNNSFDKHINRTFSLELINNFVLFDTKNTIKPVVKYFSVDSTKLSNIYSYQFELIYSLNYVLNKVNFDFSINNVYRKDYDIFLIPGLGISYNIIEGLKIFSSISRGFLFPSFNDLYWPIDNFSSGNSNLSPEDGLRWQSGVVLFFQPVYFNTTYTESYINNQILWKPDNTGKWKPDNIGKVFSRIVNFTIKYEDIFYLFKVGGDLSFSYNYTINNDENSIYYKKRILYVPLYKWAFSLWAIYENNFEFNLGFRSVSERFTVEDNTAWLNAYSLVDLYFRVYFFYFSVENVFDISYEEISGYPQKGRIYKAGVKFEF